MSRNLSRTSASAKGDLRTILVSAEMHKTLKQLALDYDIPLVDVIDLVLRKGITLTEIDGEHYNAPELSLR